MAIIKLELNKPREISLRYKVPKEKPSRSGNGMEYLYTLANGDGLFLPPVAHAEIQSLNPGANEPFVLLKSEQGGTITWRVERIPQPGPKLVKKSKTELLTELGTVLVKPLATGHKKFYLDRANLLVEVFADAYEVALEKYQGKVSKDDVRALTTTVFIQLTPRPLANGTRGY